MADRFAASLSIGLPKPLAHAAIDGATLVGQPFGTSRTFTPARCPDGGFALFTGFIDNRAELIGSLPGGLRPNIDNATLYGLCRAEFGDACDLKILGEYAAIVWSPDSKTIRLSRSPTAAPPLHFWKDKDSVILASVPRAIFSTGEVSEEVDKKKIADSLFLNHKEDVRGWFKDVSRLPLGTNATITPNGIESKTYYDPFASGPVRFARDEDYVEAANALLLEGTKSALQGFSKPAVSLSGGLDSQAVAAFALKAMPGDKPLQCFTGVPEPDWDGRASHSRFGDERPHVEAFAAQTPRIIPNFVDAAGLSFDHKLNAVFLMSGVAPRNAMNLHWIHEVGSRAKAAGCDVLLTGSLGNLTFSFDGGGAFSTWIRTGRWGTALKELWARRGSHATWAHAFAANVVRPFLPRAAALALIRLRHGARANVYETWCPMNPDWADQMGVAERSKAVGHDPHYFPVTSTKEMRRLMYQSLGGDSGDMRQAMDLIAGIPSRDPTAYRPLLEFCFNIPDEQYVRNGQMRWLAKRMLNGLIPDAVVQEQRRGLQAADWHVRLTRQRAELRAELDLLAEDSEMAAMLNIPRLRKLLDEWPDKTPLDPKDPRSYAHMALSRGLTTARFIRYVNGSNR